MNLWIYKLLSMILAIAVAAAPALCACTPGLPAAISAPAAATDEHACCGESDAETPVPAPRDHDQTCSHCGAAPSVAAPAPKAVDVAHSLDLVGIAMLTFDDAPVAALLPASLPADGLPPPPLLRDLFHTSCMLLN